MSLRAKPKENQQKSANGASAKQESPKDEMNDTIPF